MALEILAPEDRVLGEGFCAECGSSAGLYECKEAFHQAMPDEDTAGEPWFDFAAVCDNTECQYHGGVSCLDAVRPKWFRDFPVDD
jgi:hypothetical protein